MNKKTSREAALRVLYEIDVKDAYTGIALDRNLKAENMDTRDRALATELVYGVIRWKLTIDWVIKSYSKFRLKKLSVWIHNILRLGAYQILFMGRIPDSAAVNECVKLAKRYGHASSSAFVNAVLRNISKKNGKVKWPDKKTEPEKYLSVKFAHPRWLVEKWCGCFGYDFTQHLLEKNNTIPPVTIRTNTLKTKADFLLSALKQKGIKAEKALYLEEAINLENASSMEQIPEYNEGLFQVQDESSMLVSKIADPNPGEFIMDLCSAPGGKSTHMAQIMGNKGEIYASDKYEHKINMVKQSAKRLGIDIINAKTSDAAVFDKKFSQKADRVLADLPCSGFGIIRRKPDIKFSRKPGDIEELKKIQYNILHTGSKYLKPGGILIYSTCTIGSEENEDIIQKFLEANRDFELDDFKDLLPEGLKKSYKNNGMMHLYPHMEGVDGFFIARLRRKNG